MGLEEFFRGYEFFAVTVLGVYIIDPHFILGCEYLFLKLNRDRTKGLAKINQESVFPRSQGGS